MAKKINVEAIYDFLIWGINSNAEDYRLCWYLNHYLDWKLKRVDDIEFPNKKTKEFLHFNAYQYKNEIDFYTLELIQNKKNGNILIPELKDIDFLFLLNGEVTYFEMDEFTNLLSKIPGVQSAIQIDVNTLKSKHNLLFRHLNEQY